jgi:vacuolar protein sorting-associated protein 26
MELAVIRRETAGNVAASEINEGGGPASGGTALTETQVMCKHEVMNGAPVKGEVVPVRLYIAGIPGDMTPTYSSGNRFSVRYFLNLVLIDEEDRRYFKQQEIILWRKTLG